MDEKKQANVKRALKRVFSMPISRSTFREMQNALMATVEGDRDLANVILDSLMVGEPRDKNDHQQQFLKKLIEDFSVPAQLSREIFEKGEFINMITSDILTQPNNVVFSNRLRRVDGEEFHFVSDLDSTIQLIHHFLGRLQELDKNESTKPVLANAKNQLTGLKAAFNEIIK